MKHIQLFNEHVYTKVKSTTSKKWMENFKSLIKYLNNQIGNRQVTDFSKSKDMIDFQINKRRYRIDINKKTIVLFDKSKDREEEISLDLSDEELSQLTNAFKKPLKSPKAGDQGRKPYLSD